jgi:tetratricopeptide (TPR) repeat protein
MPETWGVFLLALELALLHRAVNLGKRGAAIALVPLFLAWVNIDGSFVFGLVVLALAALGSFQPSATAAATPKRRAEEVETAAAESPRAWTPKLAGIVLGASVLACLLNPSTYHVFPATFAPLRQVFSGDQTMTLDQLSLFGRESRKIVFDVSPEASRLHRLLVAYYFVCVAAGLFSFFLNRERFRLGRFLVFAFAAVAWAFFWRLSAEFAVVLAATLAINGQEWYLDRFGAEGRIGRGWELWSVGGRAVTIVAVFGFIALTLTGLGALPGEPPFGFGVDADRFAFEAADYLETAKIRGEVVNLSLAHGDAMIWRAPNRKVFIDGRRDLYPRDLARSIQALRAAIVHDSPAEWKAILDPLGASVLMIDPTNENDARTLQALERSVYWIPIYFDGNAALFGRDDGSAASKADLAYFREHALKAEPMSYERTLPTRSNVEPPSETGWVDRIFRTRAMAGTQPHVLAAIRWLTPEAALRGEAVASSLPPPDPARCLLAIKECRAALAERPNDATAFYHLSVAYRYLMNYEVNLLRGSGLQATPVDLVDLRVRQRLTALNFTSKTLPPSNDPQARTALAALHEEMAHLFRDLGYFDLERDRLQKARDLLVGTGSELDEEDARRLPELEKAVVNFESNLKDQIEENRPSVQQRYAIAMQMGMAGHAIRELADAEKEGVPLTAVKAPLVDLYCRTGQPDEAANLISPEPNDPSLGTQPGEASYRRGLVNLLLGNYTGAVQDWQYAAVHQVREAKVIEALRSPMALLAGGPQEAIRLAMQVPQRTAVETRWTYELGLVFLEAGYPKEAGAAFTSTLRLSPDQTTRPIAEYYLKKIGLPVPPPRGAKSSEDTKASEDAKPSADRKSSADADAAKR